MKRAASSSSDGEAAPRTTIPIAPPNLEDFIMDTNRLMEAWQKRYEDAAKQHEAALEEAMKHYETTIRKAQASIDHLVAQQAGATPSAPSPQVPDPPRPAEQAPAAVWTKAPDGESLLVLNQAAAVMFLAVFDRMQLVTQEFQKMVGGRKR